jgi:hypothetical protein
MSQCLKAAIVGLLHGGQLEPQTSFFGKGIGSFFQGVKIRFSKKGSISSNSGDPGGLYEHIQTGSPALCSERSINCLSSCWRLYLMKSLQIYWKAYTLLGQFQAKWPPSVLPTRGREYREALERAA